MATLDDAACVVDLVRRYHAHENISEAYGDPTPILEPLLRRGDAGRIWLAELDGSVIGYVALCFGYSIEFGGRDGFIDELYILEAHRGKGSATAMLECVRTAARRLGLKAIHLEVAHDNERARRLYLRSGFTSRDKYGLMSVAL